VNQAVEHGRDLEAQLAMSLFLEPSTTQSAGSLSRRAPGDGRGILALSWFSCAMEG